jgi:hypothetical protein
MTRAFQMKGAIMKKSQLIVTAITIMMFVFTSSPLNFGSGKIFAETQNNSLFFESDTLLLYEMAETGQTTVLMTFLAPFGIGQIDHHDPGPPPPDTTESEIPDYYWVEEY